MTNINSIGIIGGDKRMLATAESIALDGVTVFLGGFEKLDKKTNEFENMSTIFETALSSEIIIFPLPLTKDGKNLNAPYAETEIVLDDKLAKLMQGKKVFCSMKNKLISTSKYWNKELVFDYLDREELNVLNSVATAEGALEIAMREYAGTINGSNVLVSGYGRIGKVIAHMLKGIGANVVVSARKKEDLAWVKLLGYQSVETDKISSLKKIDIIFNTVPAMIFDSRTLAHMGQHSIVIDLSSKPGGVDFDSARRMGIKAIHALSLPGKVAPKTSGEIIKDTIFNILEEGKD